MLPKTASMATPAIILKTEPTSALRVLVERWRSVNPLNQKLMQFQ